MSGTTKFVDDTIELEDGTEIGPDAYFNLASPVAPNDLMNPDWDYDGFEDPDEGYTACRVEGTFLDGDFIAERAGWSPSDTYHCPHSVTIVKSKKYVLLNLRSFGLTVPIEVEHFRNLAMSDAIHHVPE